MDYGLFGVRFLFLVYKNGAAAPVNIHLLLQQPLCLNCYFITPILVNIMYASSQKNINDTSLYTTIVSSYINRLVTLLCYIL